MPASRSDTSRSHTVDPPGRLLVVDDSARAGGGQMSLINYLRQPSVFSRSVMFVEGGPLLEAARATGVDVEELGAPTSSAERLLRLPRLWRFLRNHPADVILVNSLRAAILVSAIPGARGTRLLYVHELLSRDWIATGRFGPLKDVLFRYWVLRRFAGFIANSDLTAGTIPARVRGPVRRAYPVAGITRIEERTPSPSNEPLRVLYLGRIARWKGIGTLLEAFDESVRRKDGPGITITIAGDASFGDPDLLPAIEDRARRWPDRFVHLGFVTDVDDALAHADVLYSGSLLPEPFGLGVVQALAAGVPVVASAGGGPAEIVGDTGAGVFFPAGDARALTEALQALSEDRSRLASLTDAAPAAARRFLDTATAAQLDAAIGALEEASRLRTG